MANNPIVIPMEVSSNSEALALSAISDRQNVPMRVAISLNGGGSGLTEEIKQALLQIAENIAYIDENGQTYYDALYNALYPPASLSSISAVYTQSGIVYDTDTLNSLKDDLVVTANYADGTSETISSALYVLSGSLTPGTSTITVAYGGKTTTFTVTVTQYVAVLTSISCVYTQSGTVYDTDSLDSLKTDLVVTAHYSDSSTAIVPSTDYTLSGTLTVGTSTITVTYEGETDTFTVTVSHATTYTEYDYIAQNLSFSAQAKAYAIFTDAQIKSQYTVSAKMLLPANLGSNINATNIFGTRNGASGAKQFALFYRYNDGRIGYWYDGTDTSNTQIFLTKGSVHTVKVKPVGKSESYPTYATIDIDGTDYNLNSQSQEKTFQPWFGILGYAISSSGTTSNDVYFEGLQLGEILITDSDDTVVYDFVPAKDDENKCGYLEKVRNVFYYNPTYASTGYICGNWE